VLFKKSGAAAYLDLGNAPAFTVNTTIEKIEHFSSRSGLSKKDLEVITKLTMAGSFTLDEPNAENLAMFFMSDAGAEDASQGTITTESADTLSNILENRWYPLTKTGAGTASLPASAAAVPENVGTATLAISGTTTAVGAHSVKVLVVTTGATGTIRLSLDGGDWGTIRTLTASAYTGVAGDGVLNGTVFTFSDGANTVAGDIFTFNIAFAAATPVQYSNVTAVTGIAGTLGTDYLLDLNAGLVMFIGTSWSYGVDDVTPVVTATANANRTITKGGTLTSLKGDLYFVGDPPQGRIIDIMGYCSLTPNGDFALIGEDWMQVQFNVEFLQVGDNPEMVKVIDRGKAGTL
jgi:hypothetical protein